ERFRGVDRTTGAPVVVVRAAQIPTVELIPAAEPVPLAEEPDPPLEADPDEVSISFDDPIPSSLPVTGPPESIAAFPTPAWEEKVLHDAEHPFLPQIIESFAEGGYEYLVEEVPVGRSLWDAWDDPDATMEQRFTWLKHLAEQVRAL